nr:hypothetical protein MACL_00000727 [Theileria orientalis]
MRLLFLFLFAFLQRKAGAYVSQHAGPEVMTSDFVKITTLNDSDKGVTDNDTTKYTLQQDGYVFYYTFKERAKCVKCEYRGMTIWEQGLGVMYPKAISFHSDLFMVFVQFHDFLKVYSLKLDLSDPENPRGQFVFLARAKTKGVSPTKMSFMLRDKSDPSEMELTYMDGINQGFQFEYEFKDSDCLEVLYANNSVWKYDDDFSEGKLPLSVHLNIYTNMIFITMSDFYLVYQCSSDKCELLCRSTLAGFSENDIRFLTKSHEGHMNYLDSSKFNLMKYPDGFTYVFSLKDESNCSQVKYKETAIWTAQDPLIPARNVYVNLSVKALMIDTGASIFFFMHFDQWKLILETRADAELVYTTKIEPSDPLSSLRGHVAAQADQAAADEAKPSGEAKPSKDVDSHRINTMSLMLILCGIILVALFAAVLVKFCFK